MKLLFFHSTWGLEDIPRLADQFRKVKDGGFDGVEFCAPPSEQTCREARAILDDLGLAVIAQQARTKGADCSMKAANNRLS